MRSPELSRFVTDFFLRHLGAERNVSRHTTLAYRDALKLFLRFAADWHKRPVDRLAIGDLTPEVVLAFLDSLEAARHNTVRTRNARLAAIHCFFRYVLDCEPSHAALCQRILVIPVKKAVRPSLGYLSAEELGNLLGQVDRSTREGQRDYLLLALLYDTGTRIQELLDVTPADFHLTSPAFVRVLGKGKKERLCPLLPQTARVVSRFFEAEGHHAEDMAPPLPESARGEADAPGRPVRAQEIPGRRGQDDAEAQPARHQPAHAPPHQGHAPAAIGCADHHDQRRAGPRGRQVDRGLCPDRSGGQTQGLGAGRRGIEGRSPFAEDRARISSRGSSPCDGIMESNTQTQGMEAQFPPRD